MQSGGVTCPRSQRWLSTQEWLVPKPVWCRIWMRTDRKILPTCRTKGRSQQFSKPSAGPEGGRAGAKAKRPTCPVTALRLCSLGPQACRVPGAGDTNAGVGVSPALRESERGASPSGGRQAPQACVHGLVEFPLVRSQGPRLVASAPWECNCLCLHTERTKEGTILESSSLTSSRSTWEARL